MKKNMQLLNFLVNSFIMLLIMQPCTTFLYQPKYPQKLRGDL